MPVVTRELMTPEERTEFSRAAQEILLAQSDGYCRLDFRPGPDGTCELISENHARGYRAEALEQALRTARGALRDGKATISQPRGSRTSRLEPATLRVQHDYPAAHMTPDEEAEFEQAVRTVNAAMAARRCSFESCLDDDARIYFRYGLRDSVRGSREAGEILEAIDLILRQVHEGRAVRIEMPGGGTMLMPRWPAAMPAGG